MAKNGSEKKTTQQRPETKGRTDVKVVQAEQQAVFYANHVGLTITPWDFWFRFGRITKIGSEGGIAEEALQVYLSPPHAKAFLELVTRQVALYEQKYGTINVPPKADAEIAEG